ncbi:MAG: adenosylcobalamin-dependent ribonucleoside-diphosphate reductase [Nitrospirae bacterium]|nr:adenosylcobalamin-dependent ribonucleoside-diphosphate reductase [Nitrospirota bacterium]
MQLTQHEINLSDNALKILKKRYLKKDDSGSVIESPEEMFRRVADNIARADLLYGATDEDMRKISDQFYDLMASLRFLPNSPTLMNAGKKLQQLSACFVLPVEDSMPEIFEAVKQSAIIHQSGGGTGFSFSRLRPKDDMVSSTQGRASGPVSFMEVFDTATNTVKQGGTRRGANMGILRVDHPDIMEFVTCKKEEGSFPNFNLSVAITDMFMEALRNNANYPPVNPRTGQTVREVFAKEVFDKIVEMSWSNGEPGIIFIDRINEFNPTPVSGEIEATNPCGEQPLLPYESCNLGSVNLSCMVSDGDVNMDLLEETVKTAVHFLDNVIDMNKYPLPEIEQVTKLNRKIGLGVMGWADMLLKLHIKYSSDEGLKLAEKVMHLIREKAYQASMELAEKRGAFPNWKGSIHNGNGKVHRKVRNAAITTIAPTGSISLIAGCSSGIEPVFSWQHKSDQADMELLWEHPIWAKYKNEEYLPEYFVKADQISPEWHVKMQAAFQKYTDNAVSKTVNLPNKATIEDVQKIYLFAYELGCKGITVYRDGSRKEQVLTTADNHGTKRSNGGKKTLPEVIDEKRVVVKTKEGKYYIHLSHIDGVPKEIFVTVPPIGKSRAWVECISRLISIAMRAGVSCEDLINQLYKSYLQYGDVTSPLLHINKGIAKALEALNRKPNYEVSCLDCGGTMVMEEGCLKCYSCGASAC